MLASPDTQQAEREANRDRNRAKRNAARPRPVTEKEWLHEAARFGPAKEAPLREVRTGYRRRTEAGVRSIDVASSDEHEFTKHSTISPLADLVLGKGYDYNPENTFGEPYWWHRGYRHHGVPYWWEVGTAPRYNAYERRWVLYSLSFRQRNWSASQGKVAEARGLEIATTLARESQDVRWVAGWLRDGKSHVPPRSAKRITRERVRVAMRRLQKLGLLKKIGDELRIQ